MKLDFNTNLQNKIITKDYIILRFKNLEESLEAI